MRIAVDNLYEHTEDGGFYCLLLPEAPLKDPVSGEWLPGVVYMGTDGLARSTTRDRWDARFDVAAEYTGDDESVISMIRRTNPGSTDYDFVRVFESWHESEINLTGAMLELAVGVCLEQMRLPHVKGDHPRVAEITIKTEDLQRVLQTYDLERVPIPHGFTLRLSRPPREAG